MKETFIKVLKDIYDASPISFIVRKLPDVASYLILAAQLWCINLSYYFSIILITVFLWILTGTNGLSDCILDFTRAYFYDGTLLDISAWRIHLTMYLFCLLMTFND